jgi:hypothetical protein
MYLWGVSFIGGARVEIRFVILRYLMGQTVFQAQEFIITFIFIIKAVL